MSKNELIERFVLDPYEEAFIRAQDQRVMEALVRLEELKRVTGEVVNQFLAAAVARRGLEGHFRFEGDRRTMTKVENQDGTIPMA